MATTALQQLLHRFETFLDGYRSDNKASLTHTSMSIISKKRGSFAVPEEKNKMFLDFYNTIVFDYKHPLSMVERPLTEKAILKFDLDFRYQSESLERTFGDPTLFMIVECIQKILLVYVEPHRKESLHSFVFQRSGPYRTEKTVKDGIHIMYPYLYAEFPFHHFLRVKFIEELEKKNVSSCIPFTNPLSDVVDECVIERNGWLMHGSTKENVSPYKLVKIYDVEMNEIESVHSDKELVTLLSIRQKPTEFVQIKPYVLDEQKKKRKRVERSEALGPISQNLPEKCGGDSRKIHDYEMKSYVEKVVGMIGYHRCLGYNSWLEVGMCLHNISKDYLYLWVCFSKQNFQVITNDIHRIIEKLRNRDIGHNDDDDDNGYYDIDPRRNIIFPFSLTDSDIFDTTMATDERLHLHQQRDYQNDFEVESGSKGRDAYGTQDGVPRNITRVDNVERQTRADCFGTSRNADDLYRVNDSSDIKMCKLESDLLDWGEILSGKKNLAETQSYIRSKYITDEEKFEKYCSDKWNSFSKKIEGGLNFGSLCFWAIKDSPHTYKSIRFTQLKTLIRESVSAPSHAKIAKILYQKYKYQYVCSDYENGIWYEWKEHCWKRMDGVSTIRRKITGSSNDTDNILADFQKLKDIIHTEKIENNRECIELSSQLEQIEHQLAPKQKELNDFKAKYGMTATIPDLQNAIKMLLTEQKEKKTQYEKLLKDLKKIHTKPFEDTMLRFLETTHFIDNIVKEAKQEFYCKDFHRLMNENPNLFLFNNGVYDLVNMVFREGRPQDFLTLETDDPQINYRELCIETDPVIKEIQDFFEKVLVDEEKRHFFLVLIASCLEGCNSNNIFPILTGSGSNSKSLTMNFIEECFGTKYSGKLNSAFLTQKRNKSNSASPEYYGIANCRIVSSEESDVNDELNTAIIKEITGNTKIATRTLYQSKMTTKTPQFTPFLICNDLPLVKSLDGGTWRRIVVISFDSKFVDDPSHSQYSETRNVFKVDRNLKQRMKLWTEPFMYLLINKYYRIYKQNNKNIISPLCVRAFTDKFKDENDTLQPFIETNIINTGQKSDTLKIKELYQRILSWFREHFLGEKEPSMPIIKKYFEQKYGSYDSAKGWIGKKLVEL